jgi:hypothetical protein
MVPLPGLVLRVGLANDVEPAPTPNEAACGTQLPYRAPHFHPVLSLFSLLFALVTKRRVLSFSSSGGVVERTKKVSALFGKLPTISE